MAPFRVLVVDDEAIIRKSFCRALSDAGFEAHSAANGREALAKLQEAPYHLVVTDLRMPEMDGRAVLREVKERWPQTEVVILTAYGTISDAVAAIKEGAYNYVTKPLNKHELLRIAREVAEKVQLRDRLRDLEEQLKDRYGLHNLVGRSAAMQRLYDLIERVREADCNVVITGESGTGKELVARAIHFTGPKAQAPFVAVNCGALPESIAERELFGHVRGAFTGAERSQPGYFQSANGGTLFLDEFTELSPGLQVKLLRAIQQREVIRVGSTEAVPVDVRILAATNRDPERCLADGTLREDLYYRLNVVTIHVPPLRERSEDIPLLAEHFLRQAAERAGTEPKRLEPAALQTLLDYHWPGNVRELQNVIERAVTLCRGDVIAEIEVPRAPGPLAPMRPGAEVSFGEARRQLKEAFEREAIETALRHSGGNVTRAARSLGIARSALQRLIKRHGLRPADFRDQGPTA